MKSRLIFVIGGVMSGIGKGTTVASLGRILQSYGYQITAIKIDPYLNVDAGTMNPIEHGEVFVTEDGVETDQDIGNYERFLDQNILSDNYMTSGLVYQTVIQRERQMGYGGRCVETVPDIPEEVIRRIEVVSRKTKADFILIEIGGTIGEYQNLVFFEAARMLKLKYPKNILFVLVSYLPVPKMIGEMKTKPTQYASRSLNEAGIQADIIIARSEYPIDEVRKRKISVFCNVAPEDVISAPDIKSIYEIPINFEKDRVGRRILKKFNLKLKKSNLAAWRELVGRIRHPGQPVKIGIVGKYFETGKFILADSYISVIEAIKHAAWYFKREPAISWLNAEDYERNPKRVEELKEYDGIIVPGGFGQRGTEGKIQAIRYCRENKITYFGLCFGMQLAVVEYARHICHLKGAHSTEINPKTKYPVIDIMPGQQRLVKEKKYGGSMRLGAYKCQIKKGTLAYSAYQSSLISERHRHRYEFNNQFRKIFEENGMIFSGINPECDLVEIIELRHHPFFVGVQFHPEFKSRPLNPHPLFKAFIKAVIKKL